MGQQQQLLLVLTTVIVSLVVVAGMEAFDHRENQANQDGLIQLAVNIASDMQANAQEPVMHGGKGISSLGDATRASSTITLEDIAYESIPATSSEHFNSEAIDGETYGNIRGECAITEGDVENPPLKVKCKSGKSEIVINVNTLGPDGIVVSSQKTVGGTGNEESGGGGDGNDGGDGDDGDSDDGGGGGFY